MGRGLTFVREADSKLRKNHGMRRSDIVRFIISRTTFAADFCQYMGLIELSFLNFVEVEV